MSASLITTAALAFGIASIGYGQALAQPSPAEGKDPKSATSTDSTATPTASAATPSSSSDDGFTLENSLNVRDPFRRPVPKALLGQDSANIPPLERFDLDKYKLVGVITGPKKNKALVTDPEGHMHVISESMYIGTRRGKIAKIGPGQITIEEKVVNLLGQEEKVESFLEFSKDKEGK